MKILHIGLSSCFTENMNYQDNQLVNQNLKDGHEVIYISNCKKYINGKLIEVKEEDIILDSKLRLIRLDFDKIINIYISNNVRRIKNLYNLIDDINPDIIFFHGLNSYELITVSKYKKNNPRLKFYVDSHADKYNSGKNFVSKNVLHKIIYRYFIIRSKRYIDKIFYISFDCKDFLSEVYKLNDDKLEFYPLGGIIKTEEEYLKSRNTIRNKLNLEEDIVFIHTGKMNKDKRTEEIVESFINVNSEKIKLLIIGSISDEIKDTLLKKINSDKRIMYIGWKDSNELIDYLCASDVYIQPGSQSATMQNAMCCKNALLLYPYKSHSVFIRDNGYYIKTKQDILNCINHIAYMNKDDLEHMKFNSFKIAKEILDYKKIASKMYR